MPDPPVSSFDPLILHPCGICASWSLDALLDYGCREEGALVEAVYVELGIGEENTPLEQTKLSNQILRKLCLFKQLSFQQYPVPRK
jgi:hypothetical protein